MELRHLLQEDMALALWGKGAVDDAATQRAIHHITGDSRVVREGSVFVAIPGVTQQGGDYIQDAINRGAAVVVATEDVLKAGGCGSADSGDKTDVIFLSAASPRLALTKMAAQLYPEMPETIVGVTGTNGKSSVVRFLRQMWSADSRKAGCIGTLGLDAPGMDAFPHLSRLTTPDPVALHQFLDALGRQGCTDVALEISSHGLDQRRVDSLPLKAAGFTNISQDHLDYHGSMDAYFAAKKRLFQDILSPKGFAVLNADVPAFRELRGICQQRGIAVVDYGRNAQTLKLLDWQPTSQGQTLKVIFKDQEAFLFLPLLGEFQGYNALCAAGLAVATGVSWGIIQGAFPTLQGVVGRFQHVASLPSGASIYVDFAHTPDALRAVLTSARSHTGGKLIIVFGCGGNRDKTKRSVMGEIAASLADVVVITDDNPRHEKPEKIREEILQGCRHKESKALILEQGDRLQAIAQALRIAKVGDIVIIAGKGHEQGQIVGHSVVPFDDIQEAKRIAREME